MSKTKISEFSSTPGSNTDIDGINIAEGCAPSGINNAIRELMAQLKDFQAGTAGDSFNGPIGTTTAAAGAFTTLSASSTVSGTGFSNYLASPPAIGGTAAAAGSFTTLTTSSTVTLNGGTANGVAYLNGSKVLTTGSALTFDGTKLDVAGAIRSASVSITGAAGGTITPTSDTTNQYTVTALGAPATIAIPSGSPIDGQKLILRFEDNGTGRALTWTTSAGGYRAVGVTLPTTTTATKVTYVGCIYNSQDSFWDVVAVTTQA